MSICATIVGRGGPGWLNLLVILFFWNAAKFALAGNAESILPTRASAVERQG
jgi:hypothetical protein